jgi:hypothetical protein
MQPEGDSGEKRHTPVPLEARVLHLVREWREWDRKAAANKQDRYAATMEYRTRRELREAADMLLESSSKPD